MKTTHKLFGFSAANTSDQPAWFYSEDAAQRFADACGFNAAQIESAWSDDVNSTDIMDSAAAPWSVEVTEEGVMLVESNPEYVAMDQPDTDNDGHDLPAGNIQEDDGADGYRTAEIGGRF